MRPTNRYKNRDLSWLDFNARVLQEAADKTVPLLERLRFVGIFSNNLDEFFKVRYAAIRRVSMSGKSGRREFGGYKAKDLLEEITKIVIRQQAQSLTILKQIDKELSKENIFIIREHQVSKNQGEYIRNFFLNKVSPALVTIMLDELEEFPSLRDSAAYLAIKMVMNTREDANPINRLLRRPRQRFRYALVEIPRTIERFVELPSEGDKKYIIILDDLIRYSLHSIFSIFDYKSLSAHMIKITRDAQLDMDTDLSKSFLSKISKSVKARRQGEPVRFVYDKTIDKETLSFLKKKMGIESTDSIIPGGRYHNRRDYMGFPDLGRTDLLYKRYPQLPIKGLSLEGSLFEKIAEKDYLQFAPYHTFSYVIRFLREAALDPKVKSIKITIYRLAKNSQVASALMNAVKNGKEVTAQIELQARFDEAANVKYAELLQEEGVRLIFGVPGLKVHCKTCVVQREEDGGTRRYGFISTGNFHESTAKIYTDYTLFTSHQEILKDVENVFDFFEINYKLKRYKHLVVSPHYTRSKFKQMIKEEIKNAEQGREAYMKIKVNSFSDYKMIDQLYEASRAGVKVQLIIRGICCLIPGVPGMSDNIEGISIVDKFLEHPRLFIFGNGGDPKVFIGSADLMTRNIDNRVEVTCPVYDEDIKQELIDTFEIAWRDNVKARIISQDQDNTYRRNQKAKVRSQFAIYDYYLQQS